MQPHTEDIYFLQTKHKRSGRETWTRESPLGYCHVVSMLTMLDPTPSMAAAEERCRLFGPELAVGEGNNVPCCWASAADSMLILSVQSWQMPTGDPGPRRADTAPDQLSKPSQVLNYLWWVTSRVNTRTVLIFTLTIELRFLLCDCGL